MPSLNETYFKWVQQDGRSLQDIPEDERTPELCLEAVKQNGYALNYVPEDKRTPELCREAVKQNVFALLYVPEDKLTPEFCLEVVKMDWHALECLPEDKRTPELCLEAVKQNGRALKFAPEDKRTPELCLEAVKQNGYLLEYVPEDKRTPELCLEAVKQNGRALKFVPEDKCTSELCLEAVKKDWHALQYVPADKRTPELYLEAVKKDWHALQYVPADKRTPELCLEAVKQDGVALQHVPEDLKEHIIQRMSVKTILSTNYLSRQYFPKKPDFTDSIMNYLRSIEYVIVNGSPEDFEARDAHLTYAYTKNNKNKTVVSISLDNPKEELNLLLHDLSQANNSNNLHLALIGHANEEGEELAGLNVAEMVSICSLNKNIKHIHLLGCNAAKAAKPQSEQHMLTRLTEKMERQSKLHYGLMTALEAPATNQEEFSKFKSKCADFCKKNNLNGVYILNKKADALGGYTHQLYSMKYNQENQMINENVRVQDIPEGRSISFASKDIKFTSAKKKGANWGLNPVRGKGTPLSPDELTYIRSLAVSVDRFDKAHPKYKKDKTMYPFLTKIEAAPEDLKPSLLKRLADALGSSNEIKQDVTIHGPTKALHVDTAQKNFKVARTHLYRSEYKSSFFHSEKSSINYEKLKDDRKQELKQETKETGAKQLKVTIKPKMS